MSEENVKLTSSEIGSLWGEYVNGTAVECVNKYMYSIIEDEVIKKVFEDAISLFSNQKKQIVTLLESEGFLVPIGFSDADVNLNAGRLFTDIFCLDYLHISMCFSAKGYKTNV